MSVCNKLVSNDLGKESRSSDLPSGRSLTYHRPISNRPLQFLTARFFNEAMFTPKQHV